MPRQNRPTECNSDSLHMMKQLGIEVGKHDYLKVLKIQVGCKVMLLMFITIIWGILLKVILCYSYVNINNVYMIHMVVAWRMFPRIGVQVVDDPPLEVRICWIAPRVRGSRVTSLLGPREMRFYVCIYICRTYIDIYCIYVYTLSMHIFYGYNMYMYLCIDIIALVKRRGKGKSSLLIEHTSSKCLFFIAMLVYQNVYSTTICW